MTGWSYGLVVLSCVLHAWWNLVLKRARGGDSFIGLSKVAEVALFAGPFCVVVTRSHIPIWHFWPLYTVGALLTLLNYLFLGRAYRTGELSVVYPISRAGALVFLPFLARLLLRQSISLVGLAALSLILVGSFLAQLRDFSRTEIRATIRALRSPANAYAALAALMVAGYSLWDQHSVQALDPFVYFFAYTTLIAMYFAFQMALREGKGAVRDEWRRQWRAILQVGFFNTVTYVLVLMSLREGRATYVIALRQLSIAFGALFGWWLLKESASHAKRIGIATIIAGCVLVSMAR